jgi:hypothetical protein
MSTQRVPVIRLSNAVLLGKQYCEERSRSSAT